MCHAVTAHQAKDDRCHTNMPTQARTLPATVATNNLPKHSRRVSTFSGGRKNGDNNYEEQNMANTAECFKYTEHASEVDVAGDRDNNQGDYKEGGVPCLRYVGRVMKFNERLYHGGEKDQCGSNADDPGKHCDSA